MAFPDTKPWAEMFAAPEIIETTVCARLPDALRRKTARPESPGYTSWLTNRGMGMMHSFLEGPAFDRDGNFFCVDLAHGRIFKITPDGEWRTFAEYDGDPNGLKIHKDGRIFVADRRFGVLVFDPRTGERTPLEIPGQDKPFAGLNDLTFAMNGDLYVTDQGRSGFENPVGSVYRVRATGELDRIFSGLPAPNGLVLNCEDQILHVAITPANQIMSLPVRPDQGGSPRARMFIQMSGSPSGPDGMAVDERDNLAVVHSGFGTVWVFSRMGEPIYRIRSCAGSRTTNVTYGASDRRSLFITEAEEGVILKAKLPVAGRVMYGLS